MKSAAERVSAMRQRRYEQGLQLLTLWVPQGRADEIRALVHQVLAASLPQQEAGSTMSAPEERAAELPDAQAVVSPAKTAKSKPSKWKIVLPPGPTATELKGKFRAVGMVCSGPGRWHGRLTSIQREALSPSILAAGGHWME